jgi:hypothetical protein
MVNKPVKEIITRDQLEAALRDLSESDTPCARARADHARAEFKAKSIKNTFFRVYGNGSVADRWARAEIEQKYLDAREHEFEKFCEYEQLKNKRSTLSIVVDTWRSLNAGRRTGQIM